jgi:predicted flap endonuclease-1-like 5' DNA nuclease
MNQSSGKSAIVILLLVGAAFIAVNHIIQAAPLADWWLVLALVLIALLVAGSDWVADRYRGSQEELETASSEGAFRVYEAPPALPASPSPARHAPPPPAPAEEDDDYAHIRDTEVRADMMASTAHVRTRQMVEDEGSVENVTLTGATGSPDEVDEIAGAPMRSLDRTATQEMRAALADGLRLERASPASEEVTALAEAPPHAVETVDPAPIVPLAETPTPVPTTPNDLTIIEGIGAKMSAALVSAGIDTFDKLAASTESEIRAAIQAAGMRFAPSVPTWAKQAEYAARGDWEGLRAYQADLKAGRKQ